jgi:hypothetical protein
MQSYTNEMKPEMKPEMEWYQRWNGTGNAMESKVKRK